MLNVYVRGQAPRPGLPLMPAIEAFYAAFRGFETLGAYVQLFERPEELAGRLEPDDLVVGYVDDVLAALDYLGVPRPAPVDYPAELQPYYGRRIWRDQLSRVAVAADEWPLFVKSVELKGFTGRLVRSTADLMGTARQHEDVPVFCAEPLRLRSEWRGFVRYGELLDLRGYAGDCLAPPDRAVVEAAVRAWPTLSGCSIDFAVTQAGQTIVLECNEGFALGNYGLNSRKYALLLAARWHQLTARPDPYAHLAADPHRTLIRGSR